MWLSAERFQFRRTNSEPVLKTEWEPAKENISAPPLPVAAAATNGGRIIRSSNSLRHLFGTLSSAVQKLWKGLRDETSKIPEIVYSDDPAAASNSSNVRCVEKNMVTVTFKGEDGSDQRHALHANRVEIKTKNASGEDQDNLYVAGQSPNPTSLTQAAYPMQPGEFLACEKLLVQGIESGLGIFQFVSPKAHFTPKESQERPIIDQLMGQLEGDKEKKGILIGGRYRVVVKEERNPLGFASGAYQRGSRGPEYKCINLQVTPEKDKDKSFTVTVTQVGLNYTGSLLRVADIKKADEIFDAHKKINSEGRPSEGQFNPAVISYAGVGRNATLIVYREIKALIELKAIKSEVALDKALGDIILQGRSARGPHFVHSEAQLDELRKALVAELLLQEDKSVAQAAMSLPQPTDGGFLPVVDLRKYNDVVSEKLEPRNAGNAQFDGDILSKTSSNEMHEAGPPLQEPLNDHFNQARHREKPKASSTHRGDDNNVGNLCPELMRGWAEGDGDCLFHSLAFVSNFNGLNGGLIARDTKGRTDPGTIRRHIAQAMIKGFNDLNNKALESESLEFDLYYLLSVDRPEGPCKINLSDLNREKFIELIGLPDYFDEFNRLTNCQKVHVIDAVIHKEWDNKAGDYMVKLVAAAFPGLSITLHMPSENPLVPILPLTIYSSRKKIEQEVHVYRSTNHYEPVIPRS